ncbi:DDE-type integrase/transposase/recombinase [Ruminiclostridium cellobioparum]|uniref:DDE-type integrase/transposase/recombinase n=1 Tax=Ruminiclostridium cellobioparum TaxID=29355 RepID=UPI0013F3E465
MKGDKVPYYQCLEDLKEKVKEQKEPIVLHTDQGSVYSSKAFIEAPKNYNIIHSMSRVGTPTDNLLNQ